MDGVLTDALRARIDGIVHGHRVVLFMKGTRGAPRCGFSARVAAILDELLDDWHGVDVLDDMTLREALKVYTSWPTFPQLYVDGQFVGGCDIVEQLHAQGDLAGILAATAPDVPIVTLTDAARDRIREVMEGQDLPLRLRIDAAFRYQFESVDAVAPTDLRIVANGITLVLDRASARRASGMVMDYVDGPDGAGLVVDNPNEPPRVRAMAAEDLARLQQSGQPFHLVDVRTDDEWAIARIPGARLLDEAYEAELLALPRSTRLVFACHHGVRSRAAAEHFLAQGFRDVWNLEGGIDAWSRRVDPSVPRY